MPRIQEYLPETEGSGPVGGLDPNLTAVGRAGAGIEQFGNDVSQAIKAVNDRHEQTESAEANSSITQARSDFTQQLQQQTDDGTLNTGKFQEQVQDWIDENGENYSTPGAKNLWEKQSARLQSSLLRSASKGQADIAFKNGKVSWQQDLNSDVSTLTNDPTQFDDVLAAHTQNIDQMVADGRIKQADVPAFQQEAGAALSQAVIRGTYKNNPDLAQKILDDGPLSKFLSETQQNDLKKEVQAARTAQGTDLEQQIRLQKALQQQKADEFLQKNFQTMAQGNLSSQDIVHAVSSGTMSPEQGDVWLEKNRVLQGQVESNPAVVNKLKDRIFLPDNDPNQIKDSYQLMSQIGKGVSAQDVNQMLPFLDKSPQGRALNTNRKMLLDLAKSNLVSTNSFIGKSDPDGQYALMKFNNALQNKESELASQGQPVSQLYDPNSPLFFGKQIPTFKMSPNDKFQAQAFRMAGQAPPPTDIYAPPGATTKVTEPTVKVISPQGKRGSVPKSQLPDALKQGYKEM